jgi:acyl carrier protein
MQKIEGEDLPAGKIEGQQNESLGSLKTAPTQEEIQSWLMSHLAGTLNIDSREIDARAPFAHYGLDSATSVSLSGDLGDWLGRKLSPTLVWDDPTIETLAKHLAEEPASGEACLIPLGREMS